MTTPEMIRCKHCAKGLDKIPNLCYNKYVSEREKSPLNKLG